jgi:ubiquinol-cytochrome c reductase iron-sulfur subunit
MEADMTALSPSPADVGPAAEPTRRDFLYIATATVGGVGAAAVAWPLIDQMNPDAATVAAGGPFDVDLSQVQTGQQITLVWRSKPIFIVNRTKAALDSLQNPELVARLSDPNSVQLQQPPYAVNWYASWLHPQIPAQARSERSRSKLARRIFLSLSRLEI